MICPFQIPALGDKVPGVASPRATLVRPCQAELYRVVGGGPQWGGGAAWLRALDAPSSFQGHPTPAGFQPPWLLANPAPPGPENRGSTTGQSELKDPLETQEPTEALGPMVDEGGGLSSPGSKLRTQPPWGEAGRQEFFPPYLDVFRAPGM